MFKIRKKKSLPLSDNSVKAVFPALFSHLQETNHFFCFGSSDGTGSCDSIPLVKVMGSFLGVESDLSALSFTENAGDARNKVRAGIHLHAGEAEGEVLLAQATP